MPAKSRAAKSDGLIAAVRSRVTPTKPGPKHWLTKLTAAQQAEIAEARRQFQAGEFGRVSASELARRIIEVADEAKPKMRLPSWKELSLWLGR